MAAKSDGFFGALYNIISDLQQRINRTLLRQQNRPPGAFQPPVVPPISPTPHWPPRSSKDSDNLVYKSTQPELKDTPQTPLERALEENSQLEQWKELQDKPEKDQEEAGITRVPLIPISIPIRHTPATESAPPPHKQTQPTITQEQYLLALVSRPKSWQDRITDGLKDAIPFFPKSRTSDQRLEDAINQLIAQNPEFANSEEVRALRDSKKEITEEVETLTGQIKNARFIPPKSYDYEQPRVGYPEHVFNLNINPSSNVIRIAQEPFNRFIAPKLTPALKQFAGSAAQNAISRSAILGRGLVSSATRGLGSGLVRLALGAGRFLAIFAGGGQAAAIGGGVLAAILIGVFVFAMYNSSSGPQYTQRAATIQTTSTPGEVQTNPYIAIEITVSPKSSFDNSELPQQITYTIKIKPKQGALKNVEIKSQIIGTNKNGSGSIESKNWEEDTIDIVNTQTLDIEIPSNFEDSLILNTVTVDAKVDSEQNTQSQSTTNTVTIGTPPSSCFTFVGNWKDSEKLLELTAIAEITKSPTYTSKICAKGTVQLQRMGGSQYGGMVQGENVIVVYDLGVGTPIGTLYTLAHESGHIVGNRNKDIYIQFPKIVYQEGREGFLPTYPYGKTPDEDFAENVADYIVWQKQGFWQKIDMPTRYPAHYKFAKDVLFGGVEY